MSPFKVKPLNSAPMTCIFRFYFYGQIDSCVICNKKQDIKKYGSERAGLRYSCESEPQSASLQFFFFSLLKYDDI